MIRIEKPYLCKKEGRAALCARITLAEEAREAWFSVEPEYGEYLVEDRADAFVVGFLTTALRLGEDISCDAPLTRRLYYQLTTYLIPIMAANMRVYHPIAIHCPLTDTPLPCAKAVGTGWTGGVDCMYTLMNHFPAREPSQTLTHLMVANVGTLEGKNSSEKLRRMAQNTREGIAADLGLSVISIDSNLHLLQDELYLAVAGFRLPAAILAVQKLFGVFYNSGAYEFSKFSFDANNSAYYELLPLSCFETDTTVFYSSGSQTPRIQKLEALCDFPPARKYLHPCIYALRSNCGKCGKCVRTAGALFALEKLELFRDAFDVDDFHRELDDRLAYLLYNSGNLHCAEALSALRSRGFVISQAARQKAHIRRAAAMVAKRMEARTSADEEN